MNAINTMTETDFNQHKSNDAFLREIANAHGVQGWGNDLKALTFYTVGTDHRITPEQRNIARKMCEDKKQALIDSMKPGELVFVGMGMQIQDAKPGEVDNHRIRTRFKNSKGELCFVEFGSRRDYQTIRCDHALLNYDRENETRIQLERIGNNIEPLHPYTFESVRALVNRHFGCKYESVKVDQHFLVTDDFICTCEKKGQQAERG